ncbi:unnamed protein product [Psylliodes chrysocephalus]|uniref:Uncharacterized protein n=1 Tax=Psylliodes chrysocephalus TaxID=3402493 RepID=A0A9P0CXT2_9CUCU|nr:unnamed protein product [Psylliodes chrysocephala]
MVQHRKTLIILLIWLARNVQQIDSLIAYDCSDSKTNVSVISLKDVQKCPSPESAYASAKINVQVIQRNELKTQKVWTCLIEVSRVMFYCGMHSHTSIVNGGLSTTIHKLGAEECKALHQYRKLNLFHQIISNIVMNGTTTASITLEGKLDNTGTCKGVIYQENGNVWNDVVIVASIKILTRDYSAAVNLEDNEIHLQGGITCPFLIGYCMDSTLGESTSYEPITCEDHLSQLYKGNAEMVTNKATMEAVIVVEEDMKIFSLTIQKRTMVCGIEVWQTEHPRIIISKQKDRRGLNPTMPMLPQNVNLMDYVNSKFLYIEQAYKRDIDRLYVDTIHRRCLMRREILKNRLLMAPILPNAVSQLMQHEPGYVGRVLGEAL